MYKLSPSDFAYLWEDCKHCYYQKVKNSVYYGGIFPSMFGRINKLLQDSVIGKNLQDIIPELPKGVVERQEGFLKSTSVPGTNCYLSGRYDILSKLDDGTFAVIDFKITTPEEEKILKKYGSQLHAYKYALENPLTGDPVKISRLGIVSVNPEDMKLVDGSIVFTTKPTWHPVEEDMDSFFGLISDISKVLEGPLPSPSDSCKLCGYRNKFAVDTQNVSIDDIPF